MGYKTRVTGETAQKFKGSLKSGLLLILFEFVIPLIFVHCVNGNCHVGFAKITFVFRNTDEVAYVRAKLEDTMTKYFEDAGYVVFGWHDIGFVYFFSRYPITSVDTLRKQKVWVWGNDPMMTAAYKALGISAIPLSPMDVLTSLSANLVDTAPINPLGAVALRWYTKFKYMNGLPAGNAMAAVVVTRKKWNQISHTSRGKIKELAKIHFNRLTAKSKSKTVFPVKVKI